MNTHTRQRTSSDDPTNARGGEISNREAAVTPVVLVIRDPDYETAFVVDGIVETIDLDLGRAFDGPEGFRALCDGEQRDWIETTLAMVAHLSGDSEVRRAVEELVAGIMA